jgi:FixJ family two-component response regulator
MAMITTADARYFTPAHTSPTRPLVFVIDDDVPTRESLELLIEASGPETETYASAQDFLKRPRTPGPSCLILDIALPDVNGLDPTRPPQPPEPS